MSKIRHIFLPFIFFLASLCFTAFVLSKLSYPPLQSIPSIRESAYKATAQLWVQYPLSTNNSSDDETLNTLNIPHKLPLIVAQKSICTAWNVAKVSGGYLVVTAAHCLDLKIDMGITGESFYLNYGDVITDEHLDKIPENDMVQAYPLAVGNVDGEDDVALLFAPTKKELPILSLVDSNKIEIGEPIISASVVGTGVDKGIYEGRVTQTRELSGAKEGNGFFNVQLWGTGPGSSGSSVISLQQNGVIGILVMGDSAGVALCVPSNVLRRFIANYEDAQRPTVFYRGN